MSSVAANASRHVDVTDAPTLFRSALKLGLLEAVLVLAFSLVSRFTGGIVETVLSWTIVVGGLAAVSFVPGIWTKPRTIEGIAGAAGIGLFATVVYMLIDVALLQPIGTYGDRWAAIGGGSNWWYHPVWWMAGAYLPWLGSFIQANNATKSRGELRTGAAFVLAAVCTGVMGTIGVLTHFPGAGFNLPTFAVATIAGLPVAVLVSGLGAKRS